MASNLEIVKGVYEAFGKGDVAGVLGAMDEKIDWQEPDSLPFEDQIGPQAVAENIFGPVLAQIENFSVAPDEIFEAGDVIVAVGRYQGAGVKTGVKLDSAFTHVWRLADGKVTGFRTYTDTKEWLDVLG